MSYRERDDEAHNFSKSLDSLQDRRESNSNDAERARYDSSPDAIADEMRSVYRKAQADAETEDSFKEHHARSTRNGVDSADALGHMGAWYNGMMDPRTAAHTVTELRAHAIGSPIGMHRSKPAPAATNEPMVVLTKAEKEELREQELRDVYTDVRRALPEASRRGAERDARQRADEHIVAMKKAHGAEAGEVMRAMGNMWDAMLDDPVKHAPKVLHAAVAEQHRQAGLYNAGEEVAEFSENHPQMDDPGIRHRMSEILQQMPRDTENALAKALNQAVEEQRGYWYRNENARRDDLEDDIRRNPHFRELVEVNKREGNEGW